MSLPLQKVFLPSIPLLSAPSMSPLPSMLNALSRHLSPPFQEALFFKSVRTSVTTTTIISQMSPCIWCCIKRALHGGKFFFFTQVRKKKQPKHKVLGRDIPGTSGSQTSGYPGTETLCKWPFAVVLDREWPGCPGICVGTSRIWKNFMQDTFGLIFRTLFTQSWSFFACSWASLLTVHSGAHPRHFSTVSKHAPIAS